MAPVYSFKYCVLSLCFSFTLASNSASDPVKHPHHNLSSSKQYNVLSFREPMHEIVIYFLSVFDAN